MGSAFLPSIFGSKDQAPVFNSLQKEVDRVFDEFRKSPFTDVPSMFSSADALVVPKLDISETENNMEIATELPGVKIDDVDISVTGENLTITGEKSEEKTEEGKDFKHVERSYGKFFRTIPLGFEVDADKVKAELTDGVLKVTVEKPKEIKSKTQKVKISKAS